MAYRNYQESVTEEWRQSRFVALVVAKVMGAKVNRAEDLLSLPGDEVTTGITMEEYEAEKQKLREQGYNI